MTPAPLLLDTGGWLCALAGDEGYAEALRAARPAIVPSLVLAEVDWHLRTRRTAAHRLLREIADGAYELEATTASDLLRAAEIDAKFADVDLGLVDASIAAIAERRGVHRILTIDSDFAAVRIGPRWDQHLDLAVPLPAR